MKMDKEKLQERMQELKEQNDRGNGMLIQLDQSRQNLISEILIRNGRILELEELLRESGKETKDA
jgi:small-conductance mechanosensitive channel